MNKGLERFEFQLMQLEVLLSNARKDKNPALYLYLHNARTPLFMLEALCKLYAFMHNNKKFNKLKEHFKLLEDGIGAIDYYDSILKSLALNKKVPTEITQCLQAYSREKIQHLNVVLEENGWTNIANERIEKIRKKLFKANWLEEEEEVMIKTSDFYGESIFKIVEFVNSTGYHFDNMEADVHELRRKLRWLCIYPQTMQGSIQLVKNKKTAKQLVKYLTDDIVNSPFNKMPEVGDNKCFLLLQKNYFLSLSWVIAELGKLKDQGLQIVAIKEALLQLKGISEENALQQVYEILGKKQIKLPELLKKAKAISDTFFDESNLEHLVLEVSKTIK